MSRRQNAAYLHLEVERFCYSLQFKGLTVCKSNCKVVRLRRSIKRQNAGWVHLNWIVIAFEFRFE